MTVGTVATQFTSVAARSWSAAVDCGVVHGVVCLVTTRAWYLSRHGRVVGVLHGPDVGCVPGGVGVDAAVLAGRAATATGARVVLGADRWTFRPAVGPGWVVDRGDTTAWEQRRSAPGVACDGSVVDGSTGDRSVHAPDRAMHEGLAAARILAGRGDAAARGRLVAVLDVLADPAGDPGAVLDALVGFGPGLTPSGDDLLVGLLALLQARPGACGPWNASERLRRGVTQRLSATTPFSRYYLEHAAAGRFAEALLDARRSLLETGPTMLGDPRVRTGDRVRSFAALVSVGATSGADLLSGMVEPLTRLGARPGSTSAGRLGRYVPTTGGTR